MTELDLSRLREVAETAPEQVAVDGNVVGVWLNSRHYLTIDPPTVLALLDRLERAEAAVERAAIEFANWVATNRAYNGSDHHRAQSLYNECINEVLPQWAVEYAALSASRDDGGPEGQRGAASGREGVL